MNNWGISTMIPRPPCLRMIWPHGNPGRSSLIWALSSKPMSWFSSNQSDPRRPLGHSREACPWLTGQPGSSGSELPSMPCGRTWRPPLEQQQLQQQSVEKAFAEQLFAFA